MRHRPTKRMYARGRQHRLHRFFCRTLKRFGFFQCSILDFLAKRRPLALSNAPIGGRRINVSI